jgi:O-antigen/teichoic acid export membrane protein
MAVTWPLYLMFAFFGMPLLQLFGDGYGSGTRVLVILSVAMLVATGLGMVDMVLAMAGHTAWNLGNAVVGLTAQIGLDVWLIPRHGVTGAAVGWSAAILLRNFAALVQVCWGLNLHPVGKATVTCGALNLACFAVVPALVRLSVGPTWYGMLAAGLVGGSAYVVTCYVLRETLGLHALSPMRRFRQSDTR